jgi:hypothetical protein
MFDDGSVPTAPKAEAAAGEKQAVSASRAPDMNGTRRTRRATAAKVTSDTSASHAKT